MSHIKNDDLLAFRKGDKKVFESIYYEFSDMMYHICGQYIKDKFVVEEIVQDSFLKLWEVRDGLLEELSIKNYLYTIAKNKCLSHLRQKKANTKPIDQLQYLEMKFNYESLYAMADNVMEFDELKSKIDVAINELPDKLKEVFLLNRVEELKYKEIAVQLDISVKTVEVRMSKSLKILRTELNDYLPVLYLIGPLLY